MSDFQSLLSTFQSATGTTGAANKDGRKVDGGNFSAGKPQTKGQSLSTTIKNGDKSLLQLTTDLWRWSQIRQSVSVRNSQVNHDDIINRTPQPTVRLGVCLCIVDQLPHEIIWKEWVDGPKTETNNSISAELHLHAKYPERVRTGWAQSKLLSFSHHPNWNDVRVVKAMLSLAAKALEDPTTTHILFGTESCIPIVPLQDVLLDDGKSYLAFYGNNRCTRFDEHNVWNVVRQHVPHDAIHKALPGWCVLSRQAAQDILEMPQKHLEAKELWTAFENCWAPEEAFFPTALALLGHLFDPSKTVCKALTYVEWNDGARNHEDRAHPREWDTDFGTALVERLRRDHGCIALRKIKRTLPLSVWKRVVGSAQVVPKRSRSEHEPETTAKRRKEKTNFGTAT